jgi:hypothetical protein
MLRHLWDGRTYLGIHTTVTTNGNKIAKVFFTNGTSEIIKDPRLPLKSDKSYKSLSGLRASRFVVEGPVREALNDEVDVMQNALKNVIEFLERDPNKAFLCRRTDFMKAHDYQWMNDEGVIKALKNCVGLLPVLASAKEVL